MRRHQAHVLHGPAVHEPEPRGPRVRVLFQGDLPAVQQAEVYVSPPLQQLVGTLEIALILRVRLVDTGVRQPALAPVALLPPLLQVGDVRLERLEELGEPHLAALPPGPVAQRGSDEQLNLGAHVRVERGESLLGDEVLPRGDLSRARKVVEGPAAPCRARGERPAKVRRGGQVVDRAREVRADLVVQQALHPQPPRVLFPRLLRQVERPLAALPPARHGHRRHREVLVPPDLHLISNSVRVQVLVDALAHVPRAARHRRSPHRLLKLLVVFSPVAVPSPLLLHDPLRVPD
mmetsp:Transcript_12268/g.47653  ORF Transcript_12268/g.47653 Transcript_12268/m.47653 type:complete len:291 (+) Transcript_12268:202-1074(+)